MILEKVNSPVDIRCLTVDQLRQLCREIREYIIECCSVNPGHIGSSLGAVELIVGLHYVFETPNDKIIFDVSHQAYAHKIITGRREAFRNIRKKGGISGFTRREESIYDAFGAGHSSTSISAALGIAKAAEINGIKEKVVALIGDGALSGGLAFEGLNNAGDCNTDMLVVVNDNNMSIDNNIGAIHSHLLHLTTSPFYNTMKSRVWNVLGDGQVRRGIKKQVVRVKSYLVQHSGGDVFESMGFRYFGPIDGNDIEEVITNLKKIKDLPGPKVLHTITKKGKGYAPAEEDQKTWHAPGMFDPETGKRIKSSDKGDRYQDVFGEVLLQLAKKDPLIMGVTPAMASGCGMNILKKEMPGRVFDVGIAEEHAVTFSAGLSAGGIKPFCNIYSSFAQRAYDQLIHDIALQGLPVTICLDRAGLVGEDGATHHGSFDLAFARSIPGCIISAPRNELELKQLMYTASRNKKGPFIIRYPRGYAEGIEWREEQFIELPVGKGEKLLSGEKLLVLALGPFANRALEAADKAAEKCIKPTVWNVRYLKPLDEDIIEDVKSGAFSDIITIEDGVLSGGLFSSVSEIVATAGIKVLVHPIGLPDCFINHGTQNALREENGLSTAKIYEKVLECWK